jgi:hypothetical protein
LARLTISAVHLTESSDFVTSDTIMQQQNYDGKGGLALRPQSHAAQRRWQELPFGRYAERTLPQVVLHDPDWFFWSLEKGAFKYWPKLDAEADELARKARSIRLPSEGWLVEYLTERGTGKLRSVGPVRETVPPHEGSRISVRKKVIDLSFTRGFRKYDKMGSKLLLDAVRHIHFRKLKNLTRRRCEAFFESDEHFDLEAPNQQ